MALHLLWIRAGSNRSDPEVTLYNSKCLLCQTGIETQENQTHSATRSRSSKMIIRKVAQYFLSKDQNNNLCLNFKLLVHTFFFSCVLKMLGLSGFMKNVP